MTDERTCKSCGLSRPTADYYRQGPANAGWPDRRCRFCRLASLRKRYEESVYLYCKAALRRAKERAEKSGLPVDIDAAYLESIWTDNCPYLGLKLSRGTGGRGNKASASLDRIDPTLGYVRGNVEWVCSLANMIKSNASADQVLAVGARMKAQEATRG